MKKMVMLQSNSMDDETRKLAEEMLFSGPSKPNYVKKLFFGKWDEKAVIPFPQVPSLDVLKTQNLMEELKKFLDEKLDPVAIDKNSSIPKEVVQGLGKLGILSITIPAQYGALGLSQTAYCKTMELIASRCAATALFINAHQSVGLKALLLFGTKEQKDKWLPKLSSGESLAAFSLTEPNAGSDAGGIETIATWDPNKERYIINGKKQWTTNGAIAEIITVMAKVDGKVTAFLVTPDMPGFEVAAKALDKVGMRGSVTSNLTFNNVEVPKENILGPLGGGLKVCLTVLDYGRTTFGATCLGVAKEAMNKAFKHAKTRIQFKHPLSDFALVKAKLAKMAAYVYAIEATTYLTAGLIDKGQEDVMLETAILKVFASESAWDIIYDTMQIYGGRSFFTDQPLERMMRDARLNMIGEGSNEVLRVFIASVGLRELGQNLLEIKKKRNLSALVPILKNLLQTPLSYSKHHPRQRDLLRKQIQRFHRACLKALVRYGEGIIDKQLILNRLAEMAIVLYTSSAVYSKLEKESEKKAEGLLYLDYASRRFDEAYNNLFNPQDRIIEKTADHLVEGFKV
jgi:alkylation response protein AidB-like acyl-CoA dehydrogenase